MWSLPFSCNSKSKVFLLTLTGFNPTQVLNRKQEILLDLMILLCSSITIVNIDDFAINRNKRIFA